MYFRKGILILAMTVLGAGTAFAQISPLKPEGWTDLQAWSHGLGLIVNGRRLCGLDYDQAKIDEHYAMIASVGGVNMTTLQQAALQWADIQAPHVTRETCGIARRIAKRNGWLR